MNASLFIWVQVNADLSRVMQLRQINVGLNQDVLILPNFRNYGNMRDHDKGIFRQLLSLATWIFTVFAWKLGYQQRSFYCNCTDLATFKYGLDRSLPGVPD